jgi:hypothetical protein
VIDPKELVNTFGIDQVHVKTTTATNSQRHTWV